MVANNKIGEFWDLDPMYNLCYDYCKWFTGDWIGKLYLDSIMERNYYNSLFLIDGSHITFFIYNSVTVMWKLGSNMNLLRYESVFLICDNDFCL